MQDEARRRDYLRRIGVDLWVPKRARASAMPAGAGEEGSLAPNLTLSTLAAEAASCERCKLHRTRKNVVFGVGPDRAKCMIVGEGPGAEEDAKGEPFVGRAGRLLNEMLGAIGIRREAVYIANIVKCRPPSNRDPEADEVAACAGYLAAQIRLVAPELIVTVGRVAAQQLLDSRAPIGRLRGRLHRYEAADLPVIVTYHPAYLLRSPDQKSKVWADLKQAKRMLERTA